MTFEEPGVPLRLETISASGYPCHTVNARYRETHTDTDPFKGIWISPDVIQKHLGLGRPPWGTVEGGDWDRDILDFESLGVYKSLERYVEDGDADDYIQRRGLADEHVEDGRIPYIDWLVGSIQDGYRKQSLDPGHLGLGNPDTTPSLDEITVDISRDGEFLHRSMGQHRLALAKIVGIEYVFIRIARRHERWQHVRDTIRTANSPKEITGCARDHFDHLHPDLRDII